MYYFLKLINTFMDCFMDTAMGYEKRVEGLGYTVGFIRYWNEWLDGPGKKEGLTRAANGLTTETCTDIEIAVGAAIAHIDTCARFPDRYGKNAIKLCFSVSCCVTVVCIVAVVVHWVDIL